MALKMKYLPALMREGFRSMMSDAPEDVAIRQRLHHEAEERDAKARAYYAEIEGERGITRAPGKTRFRPHRGGLADALREVVEVNGRAGLLAHLKATGAGPSPFNPSKIRIEPYYGDDNRIGWKNVHIVDIDGYGVLGFCEGLPA